MHSDKPKGTEEPILIVDDEPANLKLLERLLDGNGYGPLVSVEDSRQVLETYRVVKPALILLDLSMPHVDGFDVLRSLRELEDPLLPPIVIFTAQRDKQSLLRALEAGARDFVAKPFDRNELLTRVRNHLESYRAHRLVHNRNKNLEEAVRARTEELRRTQKQVVQRLGRAAEYRDEETGSHILRVSHVAELLAHSLGGRDEECELILHASPMHDIGKIGIPDSILLKPGKLDADEWEIMKRHTTIGANLLDGDDSELLCTAREIALTHHEKWDGSGYPAGLAGRSIPWSGRIVALADVFDALTSKRLYKEAWSVEAAVEVIRENRARHFDPDVVDVFLDQLPSVLEIRGRYSEDRDCGSTADMVPPPGRSEADPGLTRAQRCR